MLVCMCVYILMWGQGIHGEKDGRPEVSRNRKILYRPMVIFFFFFLTSCKFLDVLLF